MKKSTTAAAASKKLQRAASFVPKVLESGAYLAGIVALPFFFMEYQQAQKSRSLAVELEFLESFTPRFVGVAPTVTVKDDGLLLTTKFRNSSEHAAHLFYSTARLYSCDAMQWIFQSVRNDSVGVAPTAEITIPLEFNFEGQRQTNGVYIVAAKYSVEIPLGNELAEKYNVEFAVARHEDGQSTQPIEGYVLANFPSSNATPRGIWGHYSTSLLIEVSDGNVIRTRLGPQNVSSCDDV